MRIQIVTARLLVCLAMVLAASPASAQWTYIADAARVSSPEAVALKDGRVLIGGGLPAGGDFFNGWTRDAWIYDPVKKEWQHVPMLSARSDFEFTVLGNGKVLAAGGRSFQNTTLTAAELFDPATNTWSAAAPLNTPRQFHTVTTLADGRAIAIGGTAGGSEGHNHGEVYDPDTDTWTFTQNMPLFEDMFGWMKFRRFHSAALMPNGRVLVAGGDTARCFPGPPCWSTRGIAYDPETNGWNLTENGMTGPPRRDGTMTSLPDGKLLQVGGSFVGVVADVSIYDPATNRWTAGPTLPMPLGQHTATLLTNGKLLVAGGFGLGTTQNASFLYDYQTNSWSPAGFMVFPRRFHAAAAMPNNRAMVYGGNHVSGINSSIEVYATPLVVDAGADFVFGACMTCPDLITPVPVSASASNQVGSATYVWKEGATTLSTGTSAEATVGLGLGIHNLTVTITDSIGAAGTDTVTVIVVPDYASAVIAQRDLTIAAQAARITALEGSLASANQAINSQAQEITALRGERDGLAADKALLEQQLDTANATILARDQIIEAHKATIKGLGESIAALASQNSTLANDLTIANQLAVSLAGQLNAAAAKIAEATAVISSLQQMLQAAFGDPTFVIAGATPQEQLRNLVIAINGLNHGQKQALYKNLGGQKQ